MIIALVIAIGAIYACAMFAPDGYDGPETEESQCEIDQRCANYRAEREALDI